MVLSLLQVKATETKKAIVAGLLGMEPDDYRSDSFNIAKEKDMKIEFGEAKA